MKTLHKNAKTGLIEGEYREDFSEVAAAFEKNFEEHGEVGASLCIKVRGDTVLDVWGGTADPERAKPWERDTISIVFSSTKGATALCAHILAHRNKLSFGKPVVEYWPEYGKKDKGDTLVHMMLDHSAGVAAIRTPLNDGDCYDWEKMCRHLENQSPFWRPGSSHGYHGLTFAWTVGELVRRAGGNGLGAFLREEIAEPLDLDLWIGLPEAEEDRIAPIIPFDPTAAPETPMSRAIAEDPASLPGLFMLNQGGFFPNGFNTREGRAAEIGSANGVTNGRGLAGMYAPLACGGSFGPVQFTDPDGLTKMTEVSTASAVDETLRVPSKFSLGFMKSVDSRHLPFGGYASCILGRSAFGHVGAGGSIGFADPECGLSFGYTMNRMGYGVFLNERGQSLIDACYRSLGYRSNESGYWIT